MVTISVESDLHGLGSTLQKSHMPHDVYVRNFLNHLPLTTQHEYRFMILLAGAQGLFTHPTYQKMQGVKLINELHGG
jgi:hypothetical protein